MAESGDVKAGGAYVVIGAVTKEFDAAMKGVESSLRAFAGSITTIGGTMAGIGAAITAPLVASAHAFADLGKQTKAFMAQTGMSSSAVAGLFYAGGAGAEALGHAVKEMQRNIVNQTKESAEAFTALGLTFKELQALSPEEQLGLVAERLAAVKDKGQQVELSQRLLGRAGVELLPLLSQGADGLNRAANSAREFGLALDQKAIDSAAKLGAEFKRVSKSAEGLQVSIGAALAPILTPFIEQIVQVIKGFQEWIAVHPELVQGLFKVGVALSVVGTAFLAVGGAIYAALSPAILLTAVVIGIGMASLAVTDSLGVTATGFGELFNSIRVDGTGLGTWLGAFWVFIEKGFNDLVTGISWVAQTWWGAWSYVITKIANAFSYMISNLTEGLQLIIEAFNSIAPKSLKIDTSFLNNTNKALQGFRDTGNKEIDQRASARDNTLLTGERKNKALDKQMADLFKKDPQDGSKGVHLDTDRAKGALTKIGDNVWNSITGALSTAVGAIKAPELPKATPFGTPDKKDVPGILDSGIKGSSVGTFNSSAVGQLGIGPNIGERIAKSCEKTAQNTDPRNDAVRNP